MKGIKAHFVPVFYLKNFGDRIYLYDKQTREKHPSTPEDVAFQRNFYADSNDTTSKLEQAMAQLEGGASKVISNIIRTESVSGLSGADRAALCVFAALQFARTPEFKDWIHDAMQSMLDALVRQMGVTDWHFVENDAKSAHLVSILGSIDAVGPHLFQMRICLFKNDTDIPLWTSDNPVVRHNDLTGKLGAGSPGVEFYLPLSPKFLLMFYDDTYIGLLDDAAADAGVSEERRAWARSNIPETADMVKQSVIHANHLQTRFSTRFIFSSKPRFHMMKAFLDADGGYKKRHVFHGTGGDDAAGNAENGLGMSSVDVVNHNLQNALWWHRAAKRETDTRRAFMHLCESLEMLTHYGWDEDVEGKGFDDRVRELTGDPTLSLDRFRQIYDGIRRNGHPDPHADGAQMDKDVEALNRIAAKAIRGRLEELRAGD